MEFWIIGGGVFGQLALKRLSARHPGAGMVVVDSLQPDINDEIMNVEFVEQPGVSFLAENLKPENGPDWIVPAVPVHLAYKWTVKTLQNKYEIRPRPVSEEVFLRVPNPMRGRDGELYASHADFMCPDDCPEPKGRCFTTGLPREQDLFDVFGSLDVTGIQPVVVRSIQLAPGVGGYRPKALFEARSIAEQAREWVLYCTACRCHGVANEFALA